MKFRKFEVAADINALVLFDDGISPGIVELVMSAALPVELIARLRACSEVGKELVSEFEKEVLGTIEFSKELF